jgi:hypothetical protein
MEKEKIKGIAIIAPGATQSAKDALLKSMQDDVIIVESPQEAADMLKGTSYPSLKPMKPFIIEAPKVVGNVYAEYKDGQTKRRERRAKKRKQ